MAAAPLLLDDPTLVDDSALVSPELALVDADLSAHLRASLPGRVEQVVTRPLAVVSRGASEYDGALESAAEFMSSSESVLEHVEPVQEPVAVIDDLPDYVIAPVAVVTEIPAARVDVVTPAANSAEDVPEPKAVPEHDEPGEELSSTATDEAEATSIPLPPATFPTLPSLDVRQEALDDIDTALRKIRDQLGVVARSSRRRRVRRRFVALAGIAASAALAALAVDSHTRVLELLPGWLGL